MRGKPAGEGLRGARARRGCPGGPRLPAPGSGRGGAGQGPGSSRRFPAPRTALAWGSERLPQRSCHKNEGGSSFGRAAFTFDDGTGMGLF